MEREGREEGRQTERRTDKQGQSLNLEKFERRNRRGSEKSAE